MARAAAAAPRPATTTCAPAAAPLACWRCSSAARSHTAWVAGVQAALLDKELEAARAEVGQIRKEQEAERARVKKAMVEMKRKMDGCAL